MTLVVNLFAGPGAGKSTTAAGAFYHLKHTNCNVEMAHEFAKDLTWEDRGRTLRFQPYVAAKQIWRVHRLLGQVDAVITDSPIILSTVYKGEGYTPAFEAYVLDTFREWDTLNIFLLRDNERGYNPRGRSQNETEAIGLDCKIWSTLDHHDIRFHTVTVSPDAARHVAELVKERLDLRT